MQTQTSNVPIADHIGAALEALDELKAAGRDLKAARIRGGSDVAPAEARFDAAWKAFQIFSREAAEIEGVAA